MARRPAIKVGDRLRIDHLVTAVWDDGRVTIEVKGVAFAQRVTIRDDSAEIVEIISAEPESKPGRRKALFHEPD
jgi:hypothetical protein